MEGTQRFQILYSPLGKNPIQLFIYTYHNKSLRSVLISFVLIHSKVLLVSTQNNIKMKQKTLVFHIGCSAGFFSEYLEMVAAIAYCENHKIDFKLYSADANFAYCKGWTDFFDPFCEEVNDDFHKKYNMRFKYPPLYKMILKRILKKRIIPTWYWQKFSWWYIKVFLCAPFYKLRYNFDYYTHDLWKEIQQFKKYNLLYINDTERDIIRNTWKFNENTRFKIANIMRSLNLPEIYIGTQIRAGDKSREEKVYDFSEYMDKIKSLKSGIFDLFILTDDFYVIRSIRDKYPEYNIYTLCSEDENGYDNDKFQNFTIEYKQNKLINLFASVEILWRSNIFVGAINANPSLFLYKRQHPNSFWLNTI